ncbi:MAG: hypothetical protein RL693_2827 [Verrucomicrobiota bacterium]
MTGLHDRFHHSHGFHIGLDLMNAHDFGTCIPNPCCQSHGGPKTILNLLIP